MDKNADASRAIFEPPPENWRRPPGRPHTTWMKNILQWISGYMRLEIWRKIGLSLETDVFAQRYDSWWCMLLLHWICLVVVVSVVVGDYCFDDSVSL